MRISHVVALLAVVAAPATLALAQSVPVNGAPHNTNSSDALTGVNASGSLGNAANTAQMRGDTPANTASEGSDEDGRLVQRLNPRLGGK